MAAPYFKALGRYADKTVWDFATYNGMTGFCMARFNTMVWG